MRTIWILFDKTYLFSTWTSMVKGAMQTGTNLSSMATWNASQRTIPLLSPVYKRFNYVGIAFVTRERRVTRLLRAWLTGKNTLVYFGWWSSGPTNPTSLWKISGGQDRTMWLYRNHIEHETRHRIADTHLVLNTVVCLGVVLLPGSMIILEKPVTGLNNELTVATNQMRFGLNDDVNLFEQPATPPKKTH